jgi:hypothetical protein
MYGFVAQNLGGCFGNPKTDCIMYGKAEQGENPLDLHLHVMFETKDAAWKFCTEMDRLKDLTLFHGLGKITASSPVRIVEEMRDFHHVRLTDYEHDFNCDPNDVSPAVTKSTAASSTLSVAPPELETFQSFERPLQSQSMEKMHIRDSALCYNKRHPEKYAIYKDLQNDVNNLLAGFRAFHER